MDTGRFCEGEENKTLDQSNEFTGLCGDECPGEEK